jgi:uroporphyrinogen III methyltransferase/synthase
MGERPLVGTSVVVTRPAEQAEALARPLENLGADVLLVPTIRIVPVPLGDEIRTAVTRLAEYQLVVFTSVNGVVEFLGRMAECGVAPEALAGATVAAIGPRTAAALAARGVAVGLVPEEYVAEGLLAALEAAGQGSPAGALGGRPTSHVRGAPARVLLPRAREAREVLPDTLRERGAIVDVLPVYDTVPVEGLALPLDRIAAADYLTFTAASTAEHFVELARRALCDESPAGAGGDEGEGAGGPLAKRLAGARIVSIGPATSEAVRAVGLTVALEAADHDVHGLVSAIVADVASRSASA